MSSQQVKALFPISQAAVRLSAITAMNTAITNVLLATLIFRKSNPNPKPNELIKIFKDASLKTIDNVTQIAKSCKLKKAEIEELQGLADTYKTILQALE